MANGPALDHLNWQRNALSFSLVVKVICYVMYTYYLWPVSLRALIAFFSEFALLC